MFFGLPRRRRARHAADERGCLCTHAMCPTCGKPLTHEGLDWLTGLLDRGAWNTRADRLLASGRGPVSLLIADLDRFKWINDVHGHLAGDSALRRVADVLRGVTRGNDVVARYGGDEFLALLPDTDADGAFAVARRLNVELNGVRLATVSARDGHTMLAGMSASVGVATRTDDAPLENLMLAADAALLAAKRNGRGQSCVGAGEGCGWTFDQVIRPTASHLYTT